MYNTIKIKAGEGGWGGPLTITPTEKCHTVLCVTGGGIHPVAQKIADLTGGVAVDGWKTTLPDDEVMVAVVDCGGTARCGVYPKKKKKCYHFVTPLLLERWKPLCLWPFRHLRSNPTRILTLFFDRLSASIRQTFDRLSANFATFP